MPDTHRLTPGESVCLRDLPTRADSYCSDRKAAEHKFKELREELIDWQQMLYADHSQSLLIVLQAMDAGGKDGTIRKVFQGVNPQGVQVTSFKKPTAPELNHDFLWRIHHAVPEKGMMGVFNRSHYEDVLVVRVHNLVPPEVWKPRYAAINQFEQFLSDNGVHILKFFLHISKDEQKQRFQERLDDPRKHWKFDREDLEKRKFWDDYQSAFEDMLNKCTTTAAPWYVIPADQKWYRNFAVTRVIVDRLRKMNPQYPVADDLSDVVIE